MADVTIYTKADCPYCTRAKELLTAKSVHYKEIRAANDRAVREQMVRQSRGRNTFPQIFINTLHIGGCDDLYALEKAGKLDNLLQENRK